MTVSADEIIAFVAAHPDGVTTPQVGDHFKMLPQRAANRLGRLNAYGLIRRQYVQNPYRKYAVWRANP
jgi:hypothetical protein